MARTSRRRRRPKLSATSPPRTGHTALETKVNRSEQSRWLYLLTGGVMLLGSLMVLAGTRDTPGETVRAANAGCLAEYCRPPRSAAGFVERGAAIERRQCAGCH